MSAGDRPRPADRYREGLGRGVVSFQRCSACGASVFFPRVACPTCGADELAWHDSAGRGDIHAVTTVHDRGELPRTVALVDLAEGIRVMTLLEGFPDDDTSPIGAPVAVAVAPAPDGDHVLVARAASAGTDG